jgi:hypothetical protein
MLSGIKNDSSLKKGYEENTFFQTGMKDDLKGNRNVMKYRI